MTVPEFKNIREAHERISSHIHRTPVMSSSAISEIAGGRLFFKCENFQKTGSFKFRGATNAVLSLQDGSADKGVATHSSGNHAAALAKAASDRGLESFIVMPESSPPNKVAAVRSYGGRITFCGNNLSSREETLEKVISETGAEFIHPYNNHDVICGQGTAALELMEEIPGISTLFVPVGGGGILSGSSISARAMNSEVLIYGCEPEQANDAWKSFKTGMVAPSVNPHTIADGLRTSLCELTLAIIKQNVNNILMVSEFEIISAMRLIWERMKIVTEPSSAVALAAVLKNPGLVKGKTVGIILTGGNADLSNLPFDLI